VHWNAHNSSPKSGETCTQHGCPGGHMCCPVSHIVLTLYTRRPRCIVSARDALERTQHVHNTSPKIGETCTQHGGYMGTCVAQCHTLLWARTHVVDDVLGVLGVHWNAHRTSQRCVDTCTQHGSCIEYIGCTVGHAVPALYRGCPRRMGSARSALVRTQDISEECGHMYSTWGVY